MLQNEMTKRLKIEYPIIQAPMAGGITTSRLVAETSNSGGLGMIGAGYMTSAQMKEQINEIRNLTANPFGINLFVPSEFSVSENEVQSAAKILNPIREQLHVQPKSQVDIPAYSNLLGKFMEQVKVVIEENVPICSFTFGIPPKNVVDQLKNANIILIGTATNVIEAVENERAGMDMVVVQGSEAGGHRGTFVSGNQESLIGLISLVPQVVDQVAIPVVAAGGIMDGRGLLASLCLGAQGVQMGTAFVTCMESGAHKVYKEAILHATEEQTVLTRSFSGKWARGIKNTFISDMQKYETELPDFPVQNSLTQDIRKAAASQNNHNYMSLWSGQSPRLAKNQTVESLIKNLIEEAKKIKIDF